MKNIRSVREEPDFDLVGYALILAFVALASAALFIGEGMTMSGIWTRANQILVNANAAAS